MQLAYRKDLNHRTNLGYSKSKGLTGDKSYVRTQRTETILIKQCDSLDEQITKDIIQNTRKK